MSTCRKNPEGFRCSKGKISQKKKIEAKQWLKMMGNMLNFAMTSSSIMSGIQDVVAKTNKLEQGSKAQRAIDFFKQELTTSKLLNGKPSEDFSLRAEPAQQDICGEHTCTLLFRFKHYEMDECSPYCEGNKDPTSRKKPQTGMKLKRCQESMANIGGCCICYQPPHKEEEEELRIDEYFPSCAQVKANKKLFGDDSSCICEDEDGEGVTKTSTRNYRPRTPLKKEEKLDECSCTSLECRDVFPKLVGTDVISQGTEDKERYVEQKESLILDCACQITASEEIMIKERRVANLTYHIRDAMRNLKELKKEMVRLTNFAEGKKKCPNATALALYEEIMKPMDLLAEPPMSKKKRYRG